MTGRPSEPPSPTAALQRLREQVEHTTRTLQRLHRENEKLRTRVEELESHPGIRAEGTLVALDGEPEALRQKVETFIDAIDHTLAEVHE